MIVNDCGKYMSDRWGNSIYEKVQFARDMRNVPPRNQTGLKNVFTTLAIKLPGPQLDSTICALRLKIDSGTGGNIHALKQMYSGSVLQSTHILLTPGLKIKSYSGHMIRCQGKIIMPFQYQTFEWSQETFFVVDAPGTYIIGLPTNEHLGLFSINVDAVSGSEQPSTQMVINNKADLKRDWPQCCVSQNPTANLAKQPFTKRGCWAINRRTVKIQHSPHSQNQEVGIHDSRKWDQEARPWRTFWLVLKHGVCS